MDFEPCPICEEKLATNRHRHLKCRRCGYENNRDIIVACLNLLKRNIRCGVPIDQASHHEVFKAGVERIVIKVNYLTTVLAISYIWQYKWPNVRKNRFKYLSSKSS